MTSRKGDILVFETKLTIEDRIARTHAQLITAKKNRTRAAMRAKKLKTKLERLVAKREAEVAAAQRTEPVASQPAAVPPAAKKGGRAQRPVG
jgi:outer membrane protein TolC